MCFPIILYYIAIVEKQWVEYSAAHLAYTFGCEQTLSHRDSSEQQHNFSLLCSSPSVVGHCSSG